MSSKNEQTRAELEARLQAIAHEHGVQEQEYSANALKVAQGDRGASVAMRANTDAMAVGQAERKAIEAALGELVKVVATEIAEAEEEVIRANFKAYESKLPGILELRLKISEILEQAEAIYEELKIELREAETLSRMCERYQEAPPTINQRGYMETPRDKHTLKSDRSFLEYVSNSDVWRITKERAEAERQQRLGSLAAIGNRSIKSIFRDLKRELATDQPPLAA